MRHVLFASIVIFSAGMFVQSSVYAEQPFSVGETWVYQHTGNRTSGNVGLPVNGDRVRKVISVEGEGEKTRWIVSEQWGSDDKNPVKMFVDIKRLLNKLDAGTQAITLNPPRPFDWTDLKPGEETDFSCTLKDNDTTIPITIHTKRHENETIKVPVGEFKDCWKEESVMTMSLPGGQNVKFQLHYMKWYHPAVNGFVKEEFKFTPPSRDTTPARTLTGKSLLKSHTVK